MEFITGSALVVGLAYQYVSLTRRRRIMEQETEAMEVDPPTSIVGPTEQGETGCCPSDPAELSRDVCPQDSADRQLDVINDSKNCASSISTEPQAGTLSPIVGLQKPNLLKKVFRVDNGKIVKLNNQQIKKLACNDTKKGACPVSKAAVKKPAACKLGKITANPFFNFLRVYRQTHCGQQQQIVVQEAAIQWNRMSCEQKCHYTKKAVTRRSTNKS